MGLNEEVTATAEKNQAKAAGEELPLVAEISKELPGQEADPGEKEAAPVEEPKIIIGDKSFSTKEEAFTYAQSLQSQLRTDEQANDMYRQGIKDGLLSGKSGENVTEEVKPEDNFEEEFYADPQAYLKKLQGQADERAQKATQKMFDDRDAITEKQANEKALWVKFYTENEDLTAKDTLVQAILNKNWQAYENLQPDAAMSKLAGAVRDELRIYREADLPTTPLHNQPGAVSTGGGENVTRKTTEEKPLDFISQITNLQNKGIRT